MKRPDDRTELPPGYEAEGGDGGYYTLTGPDGVIDGPSNGKWQGLDATADAAWRDHDSPVKVNPETLSEEAGVPVGLWHGMPNYHCPNEGCGFAHLDVDEVYEHARGCRR